MDLPAIHPKIAFINGALDKEIRLSFAQRIKGTLPEPYPKLITSGKEKDTPEFKYASDSEFSFLFKLIGQFANFYLQWHHMLKKDKS